MQIFQHLYITIKIVNDRVQFNTEPLIFQNTVEAKIINDFKTLARDG